MNFLLYYSLGLYLSIHSIVAEPLAAALPTASSTPTPCKIYSDSTDQWFDLNDLHIAQPQTSGLTKNEVKHARPYSWNTTGWDYPYNFTMNFCGPVVEELKDVQGVDKALWRNVSAYYTQDGKTYSIGQQNSWPVLRGRKLVLNYTNGSPCESSASKREIEERAKTVLYADDDDDKPQKDTRRRKNTIISLLCDRDETAPLLKLNFVGTDPEQCTYIFEARSRKACGGINVAKQTVGPGGVFGIIVLIAVLVYMVGGCVYSRTVLQQRGWRQCPNYSLWAGAFSFVGVSKDNQRLPVHKD